MSKKSWKKTEKRQKSWKKNKKPTLKNPGFFKWVFSSGQPWLPMQNVDISNAFATLQTYLPCHTQLRGPVITNCMSIFSRWYSSDKGCMAWAQCTVCDVRVSVGGRHLAEHANAQKHQSLRHSQQYTKVRYLNLNTLGTRGFWTKIIHWTGWPSWHFPPCRLKNVIKMNLRAFWMLSRISA